MIRKNYIKPITDVVVISSMHIMAASVQEQQYRGFSIDGTYDDTDINTKISDQNCTYNVWNQSDDEKYRNTFLEID